MQKALAYIRQHHMIEPGDSIIAGVSGGADSLCLLLVLLELQKEMEFDFSVVHVEHGIRGEDSLRDAEYVKNLCEKLGVDCDCIHCDVRTLAREEKLSEEEAGRLVRYRTFEQIREKRRADKIAVAHNRNDQAETMLWNMARGSGLDGAAGIRPVRDRIIRPLLDCTRKEIEEFLLEQNMTWCEDVTNKSDVYTRNVIRGRILPEMEAHLNAQTIRHFAQLGEKLQQTLDFLQQLTEKAETEILGTEETGAVICISRFLQEDPFLQERILRDALKKAGCGLKDLTREHIRQMKELTELQSGKEIHLPGGWRAFRQFDELRIRREEKPCHGEKEALILKIPGETVTPFGTFQTRVFENENQGIPQNQYTKWLCYDRINSVVQLRTRQPGDYFTVNQQGGRKKLKEYFIEQKIPAGDRDRIPLLACGHEILWIVGYRISEAAKVEETTEKIIEITFREES